MYQKNVEKLNVINGSLLNQYLHHGCHSIGDALFYCKQ